MNCSKCGSEMKFVGSISRGKMECPRCDTSDEGKADNLAKPAPSHIQAAMQRMRDYEDYTQHNKGTCPYCARLAGHFDYVACSASYNIDEAAVTLFQTGSSPKPAPSSLICVGKKLNISGLTIVDQTVDHASQAIFTTVLFSGYVVTVQRNFQDFMTNNWQVGKVIKFYRNGMQP